VATNVTASLSGGEAIYGRHAVLEALLSGEEVLEVRVAESAKPEGTLRDILNAARRAQVAVKFVPPATLDRELAASGARGRHQGVSARISAYRYRDLAEIVAASMLDGTDLFCLAIDAVQDIHNLGSLLRTAEAVGVHGVVISDREAAAVTPAVRNASAGAVAHLRVARMDLARAIQELTGRRVRVVGLAADGEASVFEADLSGPICLVVGGEASGLRAPVARRLDTTVRLPMLGKVASLNAAVAGSIVLYEALRQRAPSRC